MNIKKIKIFIVLTFLMVMCFSSLTYADVKVHNEVTTENENGTEYVVSVKSAIVITKNRTLPGGFTMDKPSGLEHGERVNNPVFKYNGAAANNLEFVLTYTDANGIERTKTVSYAGSMYYDKDQGYVMAMDVNGEITAGTLSVTFYDENGVQHTVPFGEIGTDITVSREDVTEDEPGFLGKLWKFITDTFNEVARLVEEVAVELLLPLGDGVLYIITASVGESVTIDRLVFNGVGKVNIDYWNGIVPGSKDVKAVMSGVVIPWYRVFYKIAIIVYVAMLVVVGIQVLLNSTAEKKAKYKEVMVSWVVGVMMLTMFPFVLKYIVQLNNVAIGSMYSYMTNGASISGRYIPEILMVDVTKAMKTFGTLQFVDAMSEQDLTQIAITQINDNMLQIRAQAQVQKKIALVAIYFILMGQMIVLLFMYYKRAFMLAFLITLFPLVAMTYVIDKVGDKKAQSFEIWFKEYIVNVVVQIFHAAVYVIIVSTGIHAYVESGYKEWLFMLLSILFLFQGEKILRNIFGINSKANTMADLAATGMALYGISKISGRGGDKGKIGSAQDNADMSDATTRQGIRNSYGARGAGTPEGGSAGGGTGGGSGAGGEAHNQGSYTGNDPVGVENTGYDERAAQDTVTRSAMARRITRGLASRATNFAGKAVGTTLGVTYGLSKGDTADGSMLKNALSDGVSGAMIGSAAAAPVTAVANKIEQKVQGEKVAKQIENGEMDNQLTLNAPPGGMMPPNIDPNEVVGKHGETMQEIYRKALAEMARTAATKGRARGEVAYWNYIEENMDNSGR